MTTQYDYEADANAEDEAEHIFDPANEIVMTPRRTAPKSTLAVRLDGAAIDQLRLIAEKEGVGVTQLVRMWITDRLNVQDPPLPVAIVVEKVIAELGQVLASLR